MPKIIENLPETILEAANEVLLEQGFHDFSIRAVAKKSAIAPATIYNYYPSKENILEALIDDTWHKLMTAIDRETEDITDPFLALEKVFTLLQQAMNPLFSHWITPEPKEMPPSHPKKQDIMAKKEQIRADLTERIAAILRRCGQDTVHAPVFTGLFIMCSHHRQLSFQDIVTAIQSLHM